MNLMKVDGLTVLHVADRNIQFGAAGVLADESTFDV